MLATLLIVFREVIEAGMVIGIVLAATRGVVGRGFWVTVGILGGVMGAGIVALFARSLGAALEGGGQEMFNAGVLILAVGMLAWHNIWMASHGREIAAEMRTAGAEVKAGRRSMRALAIVVGVAVLREGSEIVLFLYGILVSGGNSALSMLVGGVLGLAGGACVSALMYFGLLRIPARYLFSVTSGMITLLAAGMAAQAVAFLQQVGVINVLTHTVWDTSWLLSEDSLVGKALHALMGYTDRPTGMQVVVYVITAVAITVLAKMFAPGRPAIRAPEMATAKN